MMIIIIGNARAEIHKIPIKDQDKHFIQTRGQLYKIYPDQLARLRLTADGAPAGDDELIVFRENSIIPYHPRPGIAYDQDSIIADIELHKLMRPGGFLGRASPYIKAMTSIGRTLFNYLPLVIVGVILLWVLITEVL